MYGSVLTRPCMYNQRAKLDLRLGFPQKWYLGTATGKHYLVVEGPQLVHHTWRAQSLP